MKKNLLDFRSRTMDLRRYQVTNVKLKSLSIFCFLLLSSSKMHAQTDGTLDTSFVSNVFNLTPTIYSIIQQSDGKILIGGNLTVSGGIKSDFVRINTDGSRDNSFNSVAPTYPGSNSYVYTAIVQPNGKILRGYNLQYSNGATATNIFRLNTDGTFDASFVSTSEDCYGGNCGGKTLALQSDGKILVGGWFSKYKNYDLNRIARLNTDGSVDTTFNIGTGFDGNRVNIITLQPDGKILVGGLFTNYNGTNRNGIARLNLDGALDTSFTVGTGFNDGIQAIAIQQDGKILVGGTFTAYNNINQNRIVRLNIDGSVDTTFHIGTGFNNSVNLFSLQPDGKILVKGDFTSYNGINRTSIARLNIDGSLDVAFDTAGIGINGYLQTIALQSDGKILLAGGFVGVYNGVYLNGIARLFNGTLSVKEITKKEITIFPNPAKDNLNFSQKVSNIKITDLSGKVVKQISNSEKSINISKLEKGTYIISATTKTGETINKKFIKE